MRRPDGSGGPLAENERIDDIQFYVDPRAELLIDDVILYDAAAGGETRPFPKRVSFTGWFDTAESQALLDYQEHDWPATLAWVADAMGRRRLLLRALGPVLRPSMLALLALQRRLEHRGRYADPWTLMANKYGPGMLASTS